MMDRKITYLAMFIGVMLSVSMVSGEIDFLLTDDGIVPILTDYTGGGGGNETDPYWTANQSSYVPYTGATTTLNLGSNALTTTGNATASNLKTGSTSYLYTDSSGTHAIVNGVEKMRLGTGLFNTEFHSTAGLHFAAATDEIISIETDGSSGRLEIGSPGGTGNYIQITDGDMMFLGNADYTIIPGYAKYFARYGGAGATNIGIQFDDLVDLAIEVIDINGNSMTKWYVAGSPPSIYFPVKVRADDYYSGDDSQGITNTTGYWLCNSSDCSSTCQVQIKDGLITGCT